MENVGWIGTGNLGGAVVKRLLEENINVHVFNRTRQKASQLALHGARCVDSPREIAEACNLIFLCLRTEDAIEETIFNSNTGIVSSGNNDLCIVDTSTISPRFAITLHNKLKKAGIPYVECPVSGGPEGAISGNLTAIISGERYHVERCQPIVSRFASTIHYVGKPGNAQLLKVINNLAEAINLLGAAEAVSIGLEAGIDIKTIYSVLSTARGYSVYMDILLNRLMNPKNFVSASLEVRVKDLQLAHSVAENYGIRDFLGSLANKLFSLCIEKYGPTLDQTECLKLYME